MPAQPKPIAFGGLSNSLAETIESANSAWAAVNCTADKGIIEGLRRYYKVGERGSAHASDVAYGLGYGKYSGNTRYKMVQTGDRTGGTFTVAYDGGTASATIPQACTAAEVFTALTGMSEFDPSDVKVWGGSFPGFPIFIELIGRYADADGGTFTANVGGLTGGTTGAVTFTKVRPGGTNEAIYIALKKNGDSDANLYMVTSNDSFVANTTWTSLATNFDPSDWWFQAYFDKMFMANSVDGLRYVFIGSGTAVGTPPNPPTQAPVVSETKTAFTSTAMVATNTTWAQSGLSGSPTLTAAAGGVYVTLDNAEANTTVVLTGTLNAAVDWDFRDKGFISFFVASGTVNADPSTFRVHIINNDGSPVTIIPDFLSPGISGTAGGFYMQRQFHFADDVRISRDNILKVVFTFVLINATDAAVLNIQGNIGDTWINDTRGLILVDPPNGPLATKDKCEYGYTYWDTSEGAESSMSPTKESPEVPTDDLLGSYNHILAVGSSQLNTSDDRVLFYRKEKATGKWRRLPNAPGWNGMEDFGAVNATATYPEMDDHWMEHELADFPEPDSITFPPISSGDSADGLAAWRGTLDILSGKQVYFSEQGKPLNYAPSPDDADPAIKIDDTDPNRPVTEYVSYDRTEPVYVCVGQEAFYAATDLSVYAKSGEVPSATFGFRRLPGSQGALGRRAAIGYGGGIAVCSQNALNYYSVGQGFRGEDNGALIEREETENLRLSYQRFLSDLHILAITGSAGTFTITLGGQTTSAIGLTSGSDSHNTRARDIVTALEALSNVNPGDVEVFGADLTSSGTSFYIRTIGQYKGMDGPTISASGSGGLTATASQLTTGGGSSVVIVEDQLEYWAFNQKNYLFRSRNGRWAEGILADSVKAAFVNRALGLLWIDTRGRLMKFADGYSTDNSATVTWEYETPWAVDFGRIRNLEVHACVKGAPTMRIMADDGAGGLNVRDLTLSSTRVTSLNVAMLPGVKHKFIFRGTCGTDAIEKLQIGIDGAGGSWGS